MESKQTFHIPEQMKSRLDKIKSETGLNKSEIIRQALYKHLKTFEEVEA